MCLLYFLINIGSCERCCCALDGHEFLSALDTLATEDFPSIILTEGARLNVSGETLEKNDLETLLNRHWLNDKARWGPMHSVSHKLICIDCWFTCIRLWHCVILTALQTFGTVSTFIAWPQGGVQRIVCLWFYRSGCLCVLCRLSMHSYLQCVLSTTNSQQNMCTFSRHIWLLCGIGTYSIDGCSPVWVP